MLSTIVLCLLAYVLGVYRNELTSSLLGLLTRDLPDTQVIPIGHAPMRLPSWAVAGEYLLHDNGRMRNVTLSAYARYLAGQHADLLMLTRATTIERYDAVTPTNGHYTRVRRTRTARTCLDTSCSERSARMAHTSYVLGMVRA